MKLRRPEVLLSREPRRTRFQRRPSSCTASYEIVSAGFSDISNTYRKHATVSPFRASCCTPLPAPSPLHLFTHCHAGSPSSSCDPTYWLRSTPIACSCLLLPAAPTKHKPLLFITCRTADQLLGRNGGGSGGDTGIFGESSHTPGGSPRFSSKKRRDTRRAILLKLTCLNLFLALILIIVGGAGPQYPGHSGTTNNPVPNWVSTRRCYISSGSKKRQHVPENVTLFIATLHLMACGIENNVPKNHAKTMSLSSTLHVGSSTNCQHFSNPLSSPPLCVQTRSSLPFQ